MKNMMKQMRTVRMSVGMIDTLIMCTLESLEINKKTRGSKDWDCPKDRLVMRRRLMDANKKLMSVMP